MKRILSIVIFVHLAFSVMAQKHNVKLGISELVQIKPTLQYELIIDESKSLQLAFSYQVERGILWTNFLSNEYIEPGYTSNTNGFEILPEFRFYTGAAIAPQGSYLSLLGNYQQKDFNITNIILEEATNELTASRSDIGLGIQFGYQWLINEKITIDFYYFGLMVNYTTMEGEIITNDDSVDFGALKEDFEEAISSYQFLSNRLTVEDTENSLKLTAKTLMPDIRIGISLGMAF
jgi:hypothetical protein